MNGVLKPLPKEQWVTHLRGSSSRWLLWRWWARIQSRLAFMSAGLLLALNGALLLPSVGNTALRLLGAFVLRNMTWIILTLKLGARLLRKHSGWRSLESWPAACRKWNRPLPGRYLQVTTPSVTRFPTFLNHFPVEECSLGSKTDGRSGAHYPLHKREEITRGWQDLPGEVQFPGPWRSVSKRTRSASFRALLTWCFLTGSSFARPSHWVIQGTPNQPEAFLVSKSPARSVSERGWAQRAVISWISVPDRPRPSLYTTEPTRRALPADAVDLVEFPGHLPGPRGAASRLPVSVPAAHTARPSPERTPSRGVTQRLLSVSVGHVRRPQSV